MLVAPKYLKFHEPITSAKHFGNLGINCMLLDMKKGMLIYYAKNRNKFGSKNFLVSICYMVLEMVHNMQQKDE